MRSKGMTTLLMSAAALLVAGAAHAGGITGLVDGFFDAVDSKNTTIESETDVLVNGRNFVGIEGQCLDGAGAGLLIEFETTAVDQTKITDKKAKITQKVKTNGADVFATLGGNCTGTGSDADKVCYDDDECSAICNLSGVSQEPTREGPLDCDKVTITSDVNDDKGTVKWKAKATNCTVTQAAGAAAESICANKENKGVSVKASGTIAKKIKISGNGPFFD